jgi:tryptophan synthase alpha chain
MSRFSRVATDAKADSRKLAGIFLTNGFPDLTSTRELLHVIDESGADFIELGMPFSDPLAEGLPIQRSSARALEQGVRMLDAFETVESFRRRSDTPVFLMGYLNPILAYGVSNFFRDAHSCGVDGVILPDLPPGLDMVGVEAAAHDTGLDTVFLIAPNSSNSRIEEVDATTTGFVYAVTVAGLTGATISSTDAVDAYLKRARHYVKRNPLLAGFGIRSAEDARRLTHHTDGFIVGSALIQAIETAWDRHAANGVSRHQDIERFIRELCDARLPAAHGLHDV